MTEEWRTLPGFSGYSISSLGRVGSILRGSPKELRGYINTKGYRQFDLRADDGTRPRPMLHRLVAAAFLGPCPEGQQVRHLDGDKANNRAANLAYGTPSDNQYDQVAHGRHVNARKTHCKHGHEYTPENTKSHGIKRPGRDCRACKTSTKNVRTTR